MREEEEPVYQSPTKDSTEQVSFLLMHAFVKIIISVKLIAALSSKDSFLLLLLPLSLLLLSLTETLTAFA